MPIGDRILELREQASMSQEELALEVGVARQTVSNWERNKATPDSNNLIKMTDIFGVPSDYLLGKTDTPASPTQWNTEGAGSDQGKREDEATKSAKPSPDIPLKSDGTIIRDVTMVPVISNVTVCAGDGVAYPDVQWEIEEYYPIATKDLLGYSWQTKQFIAMNVEGDSMEPMINDGDRILFAEGPDISSGRIYVVSWHEHLFVRGVFENRDGSITLKPVNKTYPDIEVEAGDENFFVLGLVLKRLFEEPIRGMF